jgi:hypothetical protein
MGTIPETSCFKRMYAILRDRRGISLLLIVFLMVALSIAAIGVLTMGAKLRSVEKERVTPARMEAIRRALQRYYLSHHDLPDAATMNPQYTVPAKELNLPQEYRFDKDGQFIRYDCRRLLNPVVVNINILGLTVRGKQTAAVLVAPGPDRVIAASHQDTTTNVYDDAEDDLMVGVSLDAEAMKIAARAVAILQAAARAYDGQFDPGAYNAQFNWINNDGDTYYPPCIVIPGVPPNNIPTYITPQPQPIIDEGNGGYPASTNTRDAYVAATGGSGTGCIRYGKLTNDPNRGTASLDGCNTAASDIAAVFGLSTRYAVDPWGHFYQWGSAALFGTLDATDTAAEDAARDRHYWAFYSMGPDGTANTADDITPTTDRIVGFHATEPPP